MSQVLENTTIWHWPESDEVVDLSPFTLRKWTEHRGDSPITLARPRKKRGVSEEPSPAYLLKSAASAIGERVSFLLARRLNLPRSIVAWADYTERPVVAIRFEPDAWYPDKIDTVLGTAQAGDRKENLVNPLDKYRHVAMYMVLQEYDGMEFMVRDRVLFRIDTASVGDNLWSEAVNTLYPRPASEDDLALRIDRFRSRAEDVGESTPEGRAAFLDTLARIVEHPEWDQVVADDVRGCPGRELRVPMSRLLQAEGLTPDEVAQMRPWWEISLTDHMADAYLNMMRRQRAAMREVLAEAE